MAERPRSHGLFSADGPVDLEKTMEKLNGHTGPVWIFVYSLKREDAARLGYESSEGWRKLLLAHQTELAQAMKIPPSSFRWYAAFHDGKHHPHIHMMVWSSDPKQEYLTQKGIKNMRSQLSNEIFQDELLSLYQQKDLSYQQTQDATMEAIGQLIREMENGLCHRPGHREADGDAGRDAVRGQGQEGIRLSQTVGEGSGRRHLGWTGVLLQEHAPGTPAPLQAEEFKAIKNMVIREAEQAQVLEKLWQSGFPLAAYQLSECRRDGMGVLFDDEQAEQWFRRAAETGYGFAQYTLGKLL